MSIIRYRFKSSKDFDSITFEGNGIHVWELKDEIISAKKLARSADFDLIISNAQSNEGKYLSLFLFLIRSLVRLFTFVMSLSPTHILWTRHRLHG